MRRLIFATNIIFVLTTCAYSLDLYIGTNLYASYSLEELHTFAYPIAGEAVAGIAANEIFPLVIDPWRVVVEYADGRVEETGDTVAELLSLWFFLCGDSSIDLVTGTARLPGVSKIVVNGEPVPERDLEVWVSWEGVPTLRDEIALFSRNHKLDISVVEIPKISTKLIAVDRAGGKLPDVVMIQSGFFHPLVESRILQPVDDVHAPGVADMARGAFSYKGRQWGVPSYFDTQLVYYNRDAVADEEMRDLTLASMESLARKLKTSFEQPPLAWQAYSTMWFIPFQIGFGKTRLIDTDGGITINDLPSVEALTYLVRLTAQELLAPLDKDAMHNKFMSGDLPIIMSGSYMIPAFQQADLNFGLVAYPLTYNEGRRISPLLDFKAFSVTRKTKHPIVARRLVSFLAGDGAQRRFSAANAKLPTGSYVLESQNGPYREAFMVSARDGTVIPPGPEFAVYKNVMWKLMSLALSGRMDPNDVLNAGQKVFDERIESVRRYDEP